MTMTTRSGRSKNKKSKLSINFNSNHINFYNISINNSKTTPISSQQLTPVTTVTTVTNVSRLNMILHDQYDPDELFYTNELSNIDDDEYNTDYEDN